MNDRAMYGYSSMMNGAAQNASMPMPAYAMPNCEQDAKKQDLGDLLQQIMAITDQSLDEAQARCVLFSILHKYKYIKRHIQITHMRYINVTWMASRSSKEYRKSTWIGCILLYPSDIPSTFHTGL